MTLNVSRDVEQLQIYFSSLSCFAVVSICLSSYTKDREGERYVKQDKDVIGNTNGSVSGVSSSKAGNETEVV